MTIVSGSFCYWRLVVAWIMHFGTVFIWYAGILVCSGYHIPPLSKVCCICVHVKCLHPPGIPSVNDDMPPTKPNPSFESWPHVSLSVPSDLKVHCDSALEPHSTFSGLAKCRSWPNPYIQNPKGDKDNVRDGEVIIGITISKSSEDITN
jgi:hypothetical protein